jgi:hypothetical protein
MGALLCLSVPSFPVPVENGTRAPCRVCLSATFPVPMENGTRAPCRVRLTARQTDKFKRSRQTNGMHLCALLRQDASVRIIKTRRPGGSVRERRVSQVEQQTDRNHLGKGGRVRERCVSQVEQVLQQQPVLHRNV